MSESSTSIPAGLYETAIGESNRDYYLKRFLAFDKKGEKLRGSWNWAAFAFTGFWALYRRMYGWFFVFWLATTVVGIVNKKDPAAGALVFLVFSFFWIWFAIYANALYHRKVKNRSITLINSADENSTAVTRFQSGSGTVSWIPKVLAGFVLIGVLAAIGIPAYIKTQNTQISHGTAGESGSNRKGSFVLESPPSVDVARRQETDWSQYTPVKPDLPDFQNILKAAARGDVVAQTFVSLSYLSGAVVPKDVSKAFFWARKAGESGDPGGQSHLADVYADGIGTPRDDVLAIEWFRLAAEQGHGYAQFRLGQIYLWGRGLPTDNRQAYFWFLLSSAKGDSDAVKMRDHVETLITAKQRTDAQAAARAWKPKSS